MFKRLLLALLCSAPSVCFGALNVSGQFNNSGSYTIGIGSPIATPAAAIPAIVQSSAAQSGASLSVMSTTFTTPSLAGSKIVFDFLNGGNTPSTPVDNIGNLYTLWMARSNAGTKIWTFLSTGPTQGVTWIQISFSANVSHSVMAAEISGLQNSSTTSVMSGTGTTSTTEVSDTTATVSGQSTFYFCTASDDAGASDAFTAGSGYTRDVNLVHLSGTIQLFTEWQNSTSDLGCTGTLASGAKWVIGGFAWQ